MKINRIVVLLLWVVFAALSGVTAQTHQSMSNEIGVVKFPITCENPATQEDFNHAMALLHSFWYDRAVKSFYEISLKEPQCAMAYWGIAMSYFHLLWEPPTPEEIEKAKGALDKAQHVGARTERERLYIDAIAAFYKDADKLDHFSRVRAYSQAMERLHSAFPDDQEAAILYALSLDAAALKTDKTLANQRKAGEILTKVFETQPNHPGVAHYIIHSYDSPQLASLALDAAQKYSKIAPAAPHALHMPSHIFVRLGLWEDDIKANLVSAGAAEKNLKESNPKATSFDALHAWDYIVYGYLQTGQDKKAKEVVDAVLQSDQFDKPNIAASYALAAIPARYALERHQWSAAAALSVHPKNFPWDRYPWAEALTWFARAIGSARSGDPVSAHKNVEKLQTLYDASVAKKDVYWPGQVEILRQAAEAWTARAEGKNEEALKLMRSAADLEDATDKHPVTPGSLIPERELLGEMLLDLNQPKQALVEFETSLKLAVHRFNGIYGAARAAELSGEKEKAQSYYAKLVALCEKADTDRPEVQSARTFLAKK